MPASKRIVQFARASASKSTSLNESPNYYGYSKHEQRIDDKILLRKTNGYAFIILNEVAIELDFVAKWGRRNRYKSPIYAI